MERRAHAYSMVDKYLDKAVEDYQTLISKYPEKRSYRVRMEEVNKAIGERNEKMKKVNFFVFFVRPEIR